MSSGEDVLELLSSLVDKSLVRADQTSDGAVRYRLFETVRQYALERLEERGEAEVLRRRHAAFFLGVAETAAPELTGPRQVEWLGRLEGEHDNLRAALAWSLDGRDGETGGRLVASLWRFWYTHGHLSEGRRWLGRALTDLGALPPAVRARALCGAGVLAWAQTEYEPGTTLLEESVALLREAGDESDLASTLSNLGVVLGTRGAYDRSREVLEESLVLARKLGDARGISVSVSNLAEVAYYQGDYDAARVYFEESLAMDQAAGDGHSRAVGLNNLGEILRLQGDHERAAVLFEESLSLFRTLDAHFGTAAVLRNLGDVMSGRGEHGRAASLLAESLSLSQDIGDRNLVAGCLEAFAVLAVARTQVERAARLFGSGEALREAVGAHLSPTDSTLLQPSLDAARSQLEEEVWNSAWAEGRRMSLERAVEYALEPDAPAVVRSQDVTDGHALSDLSPREREVAALLARGLTNRQIGAELVISQRTADAHVRAILRKLGLSARAQVAAWATKHGLFEPDAY